MASIGQVGNRGGIGAQRLDLDLEAGVGRGVHGEALGLVVGLPVLPRAGCHPEAVDEDDRVGGGHGVVSCGCEVVGARRVNRLSEPRWR